MITKSVSCFARNTVGSLSAIQTLKEGETLRACPRQKMALFYEDKKEKEKEEK